VVDPAVLLPPASQGPPHAHADAQLTRWPLKRRQTAVGRAPVVPGLHAPVLDVALGAPPGLQGLWVRVGDLALRRGRAVLRARLHPLRGARRRPGAVFRTTPPWHPWGRPLRM